jgi:hypothetical protein
MENMTRTVYASALQSALYLNLPVPILANSTLNELFGIQPTVLPSTNPTAGYYSLGNGGHTFTVGADGIPKPEPIQHLATDASAYKPFPFVLCLPTADLSAAERANYALRTFETFNGIQYVAYYMKRINFTGVTVNMNFNTVDPTTGAVTTTAFVPNATNLAPTPPVVTSTGVNITGSDFVSADALVDLSLSATDCANLINVAQIMYNDPNAAIISEVLLCSGVNYAITAQGAGASTFSFNEVIGAQVILDVGATEPLLNLTGSTTPTT